LTRVTLDELLVAFPEIAYRVMRGHDLTPEDRVVALEAVELLEKIVRDLRRLLAS
jgi:hypothetical protein